jgi:hypothetical protein
MSVQLSAPQEGSSIAMTAERAADALGDMLVKSGIKPIYNDESEDKAGAPKVEAKVEDTNSEEAGDVKEVKEVEKVEAKTEVVIDKGIETKAAEVKIETTPEDQEYLDFLEGKDKKSEVTGVAEKTETKKATKEIDVETKAKLDKYESTLSDPFISAVAEWRRKGGNDFNEFIKTTGLSNPQALTIAELYTKEATSLGLTGEELEEAVNEKVDNFHNLPKLDQKSIEKQLREKAKTEQDERLKTFTTDSQSQDKELEALGQQATQKINEKIEQLTGKKWRGLLITPELSKAIHELTPNYAMPVIDNNRIVGYNVDDAIEFAIWKASDNGRKLLKANFDMGDTRGFERAIKERTRVSENNATGSVVASTSPNNAETSLKDAFPNMHGGVSLSKDTKRN